TRLSDGAHYGLEVVDINDDGKLDIIAAQSYGAGGITGNRAIVAFANPSWSKIKEMPTPGSCPFVHALAWNSFDTSRKQLFFTCESQVGLADLATNELRMVSPPLDFDVGIQNHMFAVRTSSGQPRLLVAADLGVHSLAPTINSIPYVNPTNACLP